MKFRVDQIDHAELTVPDRLDAANWYRQILGLEILPEYRFWADDPRGPLMIGTANAGTKLAFFEDKPTGSRRTVGFHLLAFRVKGNDFLTFLSMLDKLQLSDSENKIVTRDDVTDHSLAFSLYFCDPWGHQLELTSYDHKTVRESLRQAV